MQVNRVSFTGIKVYPKDNKEVKYLYNQLMDIVKQEHYSAVFATDRVDLPNNNKLMEILNQLKIKFIKD